MPARPTCQSNRLPRQCRQGCHHGRFPPANPQFNPPISCDGDKAVDFVVSDSADHTLGREHRQPRTAARKSGRRDGERCRQRQEGGAHDAPGKGHPDLIAVSSDPGQSRPHDRSPIMADRNRRSYWHRTGCFAGGSRSWRPWFWWPGAGLTEVAPISMSAPALQPRAGELSGRGHRRR